MTDTIVDNVYKKVLSEIASHNLAGTCFFSSVIMQSILKMKKVDVDIRFGFLHDPITKLCNFHVWIEYKKKQYDISITATYLITKNESLNPENFTLETRILDGYERNDLDTREEISTSEKLQTFINKFKKDKVFDWNKVPIEQRIVAYKCFVSCGQKAPFAKPNPHHYNWIKDKFVRDKFRDVSDDIKDYPFSSSPFGALLLHEILNTYDIESKVTSCMKKIGKDTFYNICLKIDGVFIDTNEFFRMNSLFGIAEYRDFSLREINSKDKISIGDIKTQGVIDEYNLCENKDNTIYWKNAPDIILKIRELTLETHCKK